MPTYEYRCRACAHGFDIVQSFKDETLTICPACGGELRKVFAAPAISFKGSGFYANDSRARERGSGSTAGDQEASKDAKAPDGSKDRGAKDGDAKDRDPKARRDGKDRDGKDRDGKDRDGTGRGDPKDGTRDGDGSKPADTKKQTGPPPSTKRGAPAS